MQGVRRSAAYLRWVVKLRLSRLLLLFASMQMCCAGACESPWRVLVRHLGKSSSGLGSWFAWEFKVSRVSVIITIVGTKWDGISRIGLLFFAIRSLHLGPCDASWLQI